MNAPSARGLFRATGKKSKPVVQRNLDGSYERVDGLDREKDDFYPTPPEPTRALLHAEIDRLRDFGTIWEPAAGDGAMVREMESLGLTVPCAVPWRSTTPSRAAATSRSAFLKPGAW